jgi:hypothetical protein
MLRLTAGAGSAVKGDAAKWTAGPVPATVD